MNETRSSRNKLLGKAGPSHNRKQGRPSPRANSRSVQGILYPCSDYRMGGVLADRVAQSEQARVHAFVCSHGETLVSTGEAVRRGGVLGFPRCLANSVSSIISSLCTFSAAASTRRRILALAASLCVAGSMVSIG